MKIVVLNGSPKGEVSVTNQYVEYLQKHFAAQEFKTINVSLEIKLIEKKESKFREIIDEVESADGILWAYPIYYFLVPSQLKRFIELVFERDGAHVFKGKYTAAISSSMHFFDHTAHNYMRGVCEDMEMNFVDYFSAEMHDLTKAEEREALMGFGKNFFRHIEKELPTEKKFLPYMGGVPEFIPGEVGEVEKSMKKKRVLITTDATEEDVNLNRMIDVFIKQCPNPVDILNLHDIKIKGGCIGCCVCCDKGICIYNDDYAKVYEENFLAHDAVVTATKIRDRYITSDFKRFFDRSFYNGHRPITAGRQMAYIISGPLRQNRNLREILEAMAEVGRMTCPGIVSDDYGDSKYVVSLLGNLANKISMGLEQKYMRPWTFLGKGGHLIFRDLVYNSGSFLKADYEYYKDNGLFDYPQSDMKKRMQNSLFSIMLSIPNVREETYKNAKNNMIKPLQKVLAEE